jgi:hypothetical protein
VEQCSEAGGTAAADQAAKAQARRDELTAPAHAATGHVP